MLPIEIVIHIFSYLGIKPTKRCKATTLKGKICKNNTDNIESYSEFLCKNHKKKTLKIYQTNKLQDEFIARCLLMYKAIKSKETILSRAEALRLFKRKKYLYSHAGRGRFNYYTNYIMQHQISHH